MMESRTTGAGEPQITGVPRVHRTLELDGGGTIGGGGATFALAAFEVAR